jgi:D-psicose/D-tagatose/L-ribulose 3-epimerase
MKLAVSNLAWNPEDETDALNLLTTLGVQGVEVAPSRIAPWNQLSHQRLRDYRTKLADHNLSIPALQSILYNKPNLQLFQNHFPLFAVHMKVVLQIAETLGAQTAVFGSPNNRRRNSLPLLSAHLAAAYRFKQLGDLAKIHNVSLAIEPIPAIYGCDFLTNWHGTLKLTQAINHTNIHIHLDTACVFMAGDNITDAITTCHPHHFHIAEPNLVPIADSPIHRLAADALHSIHYSRWVSIEMRAVPLDVLRRSIEVVQSVYF